MAKSLKASNAYISRDKYPSLVRYLESECPNQSDFIREAILRYYYSEVLPTTRADIGSLTPAERLYLQINSNTLAPVRQALKPSVEVLDEVPETNTAAPNPSSMQIMASALRGL